MNESAIKPPQRPVDGFLIATKPLVQIVSAHAEQAPSPEAGEEFVYGVSLAIENEARILRRRGDVESPVQVSEYMHARVDKATANQAKADPETAARVACRRGCTACCYQRVSLAAPEAVQLLAAAERVGHRIDVGRARRQLEADFGPDLAHEDKRCVMLKDDGDCAVYAERPIACRAYRVLDNAEPCDMHAHPGGRVLAWHSPIAEMVVSGSMRVYRHGSLSAFVVEAADEEARRTKLEDIETFDTPD